MAQVVKLLSHGGQCFAERVLGWNRGTIRKGLIELESGIPIPDQYCHCGRKRAEEHLPNLLSDIKSIVDPSSQADPTFRSKRIYSPLTASEIYRRLQADKGYQSSDLPTVRTIRNKLNDLEIRPQRVKKCEPIRKIPETDAIFEQVNSVNANTDKDPNAIRISLDCKAVVKIGPFSRGGKNRIEQRASDHDFRPEQTLVPFGVFIPGLCESHFWFSIGPVTADITIELAYYPPYHSKYNPVERLWGVLENHWRGELLTSIDKALGLARTMTYRGIVPSTVRLIRKIYRKGVRLTKKQMIPIEKRLQRLKGLGKWFITISPETGSG